MPAQHDPYRVIQNRAYVIWVAEYDSLTRGNEKANIRKPRVPLAPQIDSLLLPLKFRPVPLIFQIVLLRYKSRKVYLAIRVYLEVTLNVAKPHTAIFCR